MSTIKFTGYSLAFLNEIRDSETIPKRALYFIPAFVDYNIHVGLEVKL
jgi:hypothetical protein